MHAEFRKLPSVNALLDSEGMQELVAMHGHALLVELVRAELEAARQTILAGHPAPDAAMLIAGLQSRLQRLLTPTLQPVINATGVIIHTNLGRALLSEAARAAMTQVGAAYSNLEYDLQSGKRGSRYIHAADLLCQLTGAEAAVVVNNNAGAVILALTALAQGQEVIISRSQLVEIGGGFRIPDIMTQSGAILREVGTTNKTYVRDYAQALTEHTGLLLAVHYSNYQITGFTAQPSLTDLSNLGRAHTIPLMEDLGSGTLLDTAPFGLAHEPTIQESIAAGVDIVTASGDKLLGGPQAGLILGRADLIAKIKRHPLMRAFRVDKTTLAALQATLLAYLDNRAVTEIPVWQMMGAPVSTLARRARRWRTALQRHLKSEPMSKAVTLSLKDSLSTVGGGSLPGQTLPTKALVIDVHVASVDTVASALRQATPPLIGRIEANQLWLDPRTVLPAQDKTVIQVLSQTIDSVVQESMC